MGLWKLELWAFELDTAVQVQAEGVAPPRREWAELAPALITL